MESVETIKRVFSLLLALVFVLGVLQLPALAAGHGGRPENRPGTGSQRPERPEQEEPTEPELPEEPTEPELPEEPSEPEEPATPDCPERPERPGRPQRPDQEQPSEPEIPEEPTEPETPEIPEEPAEPEIPEEPSEPATPDCPVRPERPGRPQRPDQEQPTEPELPEEPTEPATPDEPQNPERPNRPGFGHLSGSVNGGCGGFTLELWLEGQDTPAYTITLGEGLFSILDVEAGEYILKLSRENYVTREINVDVDMDTLLPDTQLNLRGDITGDGQINVGDVARGYSHVRGSSPFTDDYTEACADVNEDNTVNVGDTARLYSHVKGTKKLY